MATSMVPGDIPVNLNEARSWLRLGATVDDAVVAQLVRAAPNICEAFIGQWLIVRAVEEVVPSNGGSITLAVRPVVAVDAATLLLPGGSEIALGETDYRVTIVRDGTASIAVHDRRDATRARIGYRAGMAAQANGIPEAIRQGIVRLTQHLHDARDAAMRPAEHAVRAKAIALLAGDAELAGSVHGVFDGTPPRASAPYVAVGTAEGADWGTKDRAGREVRLTVTLHGVGDSLDDGAAARIEAVVADMRGVAGDWIVVGARVVRTRFGFARDGGWRMDFIVRCRCLTG